MRQTLWRLPQLGPSETPLKHQLGVDVWTPGWYRPDSASLGCSDLKLISTTEKDAFLKPATGLLRHQRALWMPSNIPWNRVTNLEWCWSDMFFFIITSFSFLICAKKNTVFSKVPWWTSWTLRVGHLYILQPLVVTRRPYLSSGPQRRMCFPAVRAVKR